MKTNIFTDEFLKEIGFKLLNRNPKNDFSETNQYGVAVYERSNMTSLHWNCDGHSCTYFGERLAPNAHLTIRKDGDTRTVFCGYVYSQDDVKKILSLTW